MNNSINLHLSTDTIIHPLMSGQGVGGSPTISSINSRLNTRALKQRGLLRLARAKRRMVPCRLRSALPLLVLVLSLALSLVLPQLLSPLAQAFPLVLSLAVLWVALAEVMQRRKSRKLALTQLV